MILLKNPLPHTPCPLSGKTQKQQKTKAKNTTYICHAAATLKVNKPKQISMSVKEIQSIIYQITTISASHMHNAIFAGK